MKKLIELDRKECVRTRESSDREGERTACLNPLYGSRRVFFFEGDEGRNEGRNEGRKILPLLSGASVSNVALLLLSMLPRVRGGGVGGPAKGSKAE